MTDIYAEIGETSKGDTRIILHGIEDDGQIGPTLFGDNYQIKTIPGRLWDTKDKRWSLPLAWHSCVVARSVLGDRLRVGNVLGAWARSARDHNTRVLALRNALEVVEPSPYKNEHDNSLFAYQVPGRDFMVTAREAILGDDMGLGKSFQTIAAIRAAGEYPALIVCPNTLKRNWEREIRRWMPEANPFVIHGPAPKRVKQIKEAAESPNAIIIMNIESMRLHSRLSVYGSTRLKRCTTCDPKEGLPDLKPSACEVHPKELNAIDFKVCVLDEAHRVKDPKAAQTRAIWNVFHAPSVNYRWALTGTPVANHPGDLWSILHTVAPDTPGKTAFLDRYAQIEFNAFGGMSIVGLNPERKEEFFQLLDPHFRRMIKAEVLPQLPSKVFERRDVEMKPKQAKAYKDIAETLTTVLDDGTVFVANGSLAGATRLLQFASAYCDVEQGETPEDPATWQVTLADPSPKVDELMSIIDDNPGKPLVIAAEHRQLIDLAAKRMTDAGIQFGRITGGVSADERDNTVQAFQDGRLDYILMTYKAGGVGITLTRADTMVRLQRSWSMVDDTQGMARIHRIGSEVHDSVTFIDLVTADTIEEDQITRLYEKYERLEEVVRDREKLVRLGGSTAELDSKIMEAEGGMLWDADTTR